MKKRTVRATLRVKTGDGRVQGMGKLNEIAARHVPVVEEQGGGERAVGDGLTATRYSLVGLVGFTRHPPPGPHVRDRFQRMSSCSARSIVRERRGPSQGAAGEEQVPNMPCPSFAHVDPRPTGSLSSIHRRGAARNTALRSKVGAASRWPRPKLIVGGRMLSRSLSAPEPLPGSPASLPVGDRECGQGRGGAVTT